MLPLTIKNFLLLFFIFSNQSINCLNTPEHHSNILIHNVKKPNQIQHIGKRNLSEWINHCLSLPMDRYSTKSIAIHELNTILNHAIDQYKVILQHHSAWINKSIPPDIHFTFRPSRQDITTLTPPPFNPYVQRIIIPKDAIIYAHGDLHGDIHSVATFLKELYDKKIIDNSFKIIDPHTYLIFCGDYVDRGLYGLAVIATIALIQLNNPTQCILVRGNHEDLHINTTNELNHEAALIFPEQKPSFAIRELYRATHLFQWYEMLPLCLFVASQANENEYVMFCHGGIEPGYMPTKLLNAPHTTMYEKITKLKRNTYAQELINFTQKQTTLTKEHRHIKNTVTKLCHYFTDTTNIKKYMGFLWSDFDLSPNQHNDPTLIKNNHGRMTFMEPFCRNWHGLIKEKSGKNIVGIIRAHQHNKISMRMIMHSETPGALYLWESTETKPGSLWNGIVITLSICPLTNVGKSVGLTFDTYAKISIGDIFAKNWKFQVFIKNITLSTGEKPYQLSLK